MISWKRATLSTFALTNLSQPALLSRWFSSFPFGGITCDSSLEGCQDWKWGILRSFFLSNFDFDDFQCLTIQAVLWLPDEDEAPAEMEEKRHDIAQDGGSSDVKWVLHSLKRTTRGPMKIGGWETTFPNGSLLFQGAYFLGWLVAFNIQGASFGTKVKG